MEDPSEAPERVLARAVVARAQQQVDGCTLRLDDYDTFDARGMSRLEVRATATDGATYTAGLQILKRLDVATNVKLVLAGVPRHYFPLCRRK